MLGSLFKPDWQSDSVEVRLQAIAKLDLVDAKSQSILENLATDDSKYRVRRAAIEKISKADTLLQIYQTHADAQTRDDAKTAFVRLIGAKSSLTLSEFEALISTHPYAKTLLVQHCPHVTVRNALLADISELDRAELIAEVEYADTRKSIAEQLFSKQALELARKNIKGKDTGAEKIIKQKLERIRADQKQAQENQAAAESLCAEMEFIANHPEWRSEFKERFLRYQTNWQRLNFTPSDTVHQRYTAAQLNAKAKVEQQTLTESAQAAQEQLSKTLQADCAELANYSLAQIADKKYSLDEKLNASLNEWLQQTEEETPSIGIADSFLDAQKALKSVLELCGAAATPENTQVFEKSIAQLHWPKHYPTLLALGEAKILLNDYKTQYKQAQQSETEKLDSLHKRINRLLGSTKRGDIKQAQRELNATTKMASQFYGKNKVALDERLAQATEAVNKMADWQAFATEPKLTELCEEMEQLSGSTEHPDKLVKKINRLQQRWKALGHSEVTDQYWERFKAAADLAYQPCSLHFKKRRDIQRTNLAKREPLIDRTRALLENTAWADEPDYKHVEVELRNINNEWQKIKDVERGPGQKQWKKLSVIKAEIYQHLDIVYDANLELKQQIIAQVEALSNTEVKEETINKLQLFQNRWKQVGITRRKQDQAAWKKFKHASDQVYAKIQDLRREKRAEEDAQLKGYRDIIREVQSVAKSVVDIAQGDATIAALQADYQALPPLPKTMSEKLAKGLDSDYQRAIGAYENTKERLNVAAKSKILDKLSDKATLCAELEQLGASASPDKVEAIRNKIDAIELSDKTLNQQFEIRLAAALDTNREQASEARRRLCIDLEILLGEESPAEDKNLRMTMQLEQMKEQGIGHNQERAQKTILNDLKREWLCLPGAEPKIQASLNQRFQRLIANQV